MNDFTQVRPDLAFEAAHQAPARLRMAVVGAGPAGLALALEAARLLPDVDVTVFDARAADRDVSGDPRTLALSQGSVQTLQRLGVWQAIEASGRVAPIREVRVSQQQPTVLWPGGGQPEVSISALEQRVPQLGAVLSYGTLVAPMQLAIEAVAQAQPHRCCLRFGTPVRGFKPLAHGVELDADIADAFDVAVVAEGGVFADQPALQWPQGLSRDYEQTAWVGQVRLSEPPEGLADGVAYERFTPSGPAALLPLPRGAVSQGGEVGRRASLVWCVQRGDDPVLALSDAQRLALLNTIFPVRAGQVLEVSPLKAFPLGLNAHQRLVDDGVVARIGNAAQTLHPVAGQGLNLGLRDVHELVESLRAMGAVPRDAAERALKVRQALARFERRRQPDRIALIAGTDFLARSFTWTPPVLATLRGLALGLLQKATPAKQALAQMMMFGHR
jgi:2-octaprenyl-6-methoxyphenol hydroxylase